LFDAPSWPGAVIPARPIGIVRLTEREAKGKRASRAKPKRNDRIILRPAADQRYRDVRELPKRVRQELERFFVTVTELTEKEVTIEGWAGPTAAEKAIDSAADQFARRPPDALRHA
jgi:inorganic pyrophosphatase